MKYTPLPHVLTDTTLCYRELKDTPVRHGLTVITL